MGSKNIKVLFTEQEKEEYKTKTLKLLKEGKYCKEIAGLFGVSEKTVLLIRDNLIKEGKITKQEIDIKIKERKLKEKEQNLDRKIILQGLKEGKNYREISKTVSFSEKTVSNIAKKLMQEGAIRQDKINMAREQRSEVQEEKKSITINDQIKQRALELFLEGVSTPTIKHELGIELDSDYRKIKNELIKEGKISQSEINEAIQNKRKKDKEKVYSLLLRGFSQREIASLIKYSNQSYVERLISELVDEKRITKEKIEKIRQEENQLIKKYILKMLRKGYTNAEIAENDENGYLTESNVRRYIKILIQEGQITKEEINNAKSKRKPLKNRQKKLDTVEPHDDRILKLLNLGFEQKQIAKILDTSEYYINSRKKILVMRKQIKDPELKKLKNKREENARKRRQILEESMAAGEKLDIQKAKDHIEYCKAKIELGEEQAEDIKLLGLVIQHTPELITFSNINFIVSYFTKAEKLQDAVKFINICLANCKGDEEKTKKLFEAKKIINLNMKKRDAIRMLKLGYMPLGNIVEETGLSMKEILELKGKIQDDRQNELKIR